MTSTAAEASASAEVAAEAVPDTNAAEAAVADLLGEEEAEEAEEAEDGGFRVCIHVKCLMSSKLRIQ